MAKKDRMNKNVNEETIVVESNSPYGEMTREEMIILLDKKDKLLTDYTAEISKLRKQVDECGEMYDEANRKSLQVIDEYKALEEKFNSYKDELDAEYDEKIEDLKNTHEQELEGQKAADQLKYNKAMEANMAEIASVKSACEEQYNAELESLKAKHASEIKALKAENQKLEVLSTEGVFSEKLRKRFLDASKKAINETFDRLAEEAEAEVSGKKKVEEAVRKANDRLKWLKEQQDHNAEETEELKSLLMELTGDVEA